MSLIGNNSNFQDLLGQNASSLLIEVEEIIVDDKLTLDYADPNKNLVTNSDKEVITEDKDSFVDVPNQITWAQNVRQFTATLPQDIAITSDVEFNKLTVNSGGIISNGDIDASNNNIVCNRIDARSKAFVGLQSGGTILTDMTWGSFSSTSTMTLSNGNHTCSTGQDTLRKCVVGAQNFLHTDSVEVEMQWDAFIGNNCFMGICSAGFTTYDHPISSPPFQSPNNFYWWNIQKSPDHIDWTNRPAEYNTGIDILAGQGIKLILSNGNLEFLYSNTGIGGSYVSVLTINGVIPDTYKILAMDYNTNNSSFIVTINGTITTSGGSVVEKDLTVNGESIFYDNIYLDHLTQDQNLIIDSNKILTTEPKDTINGTTNQIIVNQVGRDFTLSTPQDLDTNADFVVNTLNTGQGANLLYGMDQDVKTSSTVEFENVIVDIDLTIDTRNAWEILYVDSLKEVRGIKLNDDEVLVGTANNPIARRIAEFYELHQNQLCSKFDPEKTSQYIALFEDGLTAIKANDTNRARVMTINYFEMPRFSVGEFNVRFGFEVISVGNQVNIGFCPGTSSLDNPLLSDSGNYSIASNGNIYENGIFITQIATTYTAGDIIEYEILASTNFYYIYKNGNLIYNSFSPIIAGQYYPQVFDNTIVLSEFKVNVYQTYRGVVKSKYLTTEDNIDFSVGFTKYLRFDSTTFRPYDNLGIDLGTPSFQFLNGYIKTLWSNEIVNSGDIDNASGVILNSYGSQTAPSYTFDGNDQTGFYMSQSTVPRQLSFTIGGIRSYSWQGTFFVPERNSGTQDLGQTSRRWGTVYCVAVVQGSDERLKKDIEDIDIGLNDVMKLKPKKYKFKNNDEKEHYGLIAQQVTKDTNIKNVVNYDEKEDEYELNYIELIPVLIKSIQELKSEVDYLKSQLNI
jgi:hypothetical protein